MLNKDTLFDIGSIGQVRNDKVLVVVAAVVMMLLLERFVSTTELGRGIRATAQDPDTAVLMGVNIDRMVMVTFLLGGIDGRRRGRALRHVLRARPSTTSASCSASRRSPPRCSAASATSVAR